MSQFRLYRLRFCLRETHFLLCDFIEQSKRGSRDLVVTGHSTINREVLYMYNSYTYGFQDSCLFTSLNKFKPFTSQFQELVSREEWVVWISIEPLSQTMKGLTPLSESRCVPKTRHTIFPNEYLGYPLLYEKNQKMG